MRLRDRWFPWFTVIVALFWVIAAHWAGRRAEEADSVRFFGSLMTGGAVLPDPVTSSSSVTDSVTDTQPATLPPLGMFPAVLSQAAPSRDGRSTPAARIAALNRATSIVECSVTVWRWMMNAFAAMLLVLALIARTTRWTRLAHLVTAALVLLSAGATLAWMAVLSHPTAGGLPPLPFLTYVLVGVLLSAYGFVVLAAYVRRVPAPVTID